MEHPKVKHFTKEETDNFMALGRALKKVEVRMRMEGQLKTLQEPNPKNDND